MPVRLDVTGQRFGRLTALSYEGWNGAHKTLWSFKCDCGAVIIRRLATVRRGDVKSCGCLRREGAYIAHNKKPVGESSFNALYHKYKRQAEKRGYAFALEKELFRDLTKRDCFYCGSPPAAVVSATSKGGTNGRYTYTGVDRIDNSIGYTPENVVPCCSTCNRAKHTSPREEFIAWVKRASCHMDRSGL